MGPIGCATSVGSLEEEGYFFGRFGDLEKKSFTRADYRKVPGPSWLSDGRWWDIVDKVHCSSDVGTGDGRSTATRNIFVKCDEE